MLSEWTAECGMDAPVLVVPWSTEGLPDSPDASARMRFIDLRANPYAIAEIPETERNPSLARALRSLNATRSPFFTAKCDVWQMAFDGSAGSGAEHRERLEALRLELMLSEEEARYGFAGYIDLLWRERSTFASAHRQRDLLDRIVRRAQRLTHDEATLECVLRPALLDLAGPLEGFAVSIYVTALGAEPEIARRRWELALEDVVSLLRGRELQATRGSATIEAVDANRVREAQQESSPVDGQGPRIRGE